MAKTAQSETLMCHWFKWEVVDSNSLALHLAEGDCCDMDGAIRTAMVLMPSVEWIQTYSGERLDTVYFISGGRWTGRIAKNIPEQP